MNGELITKQSVNTDTVMAGDSRSSKDAALASEGISGSGPIELSHETRDVISQTEKVSSGMTEAIEMVAESCKLLRDSASAALEVSGQAVADLCKQLDYAAIFQSVSSALARLVEAAKETTRTANFEAVVGRVRLVALRVKRNELLSKANWPLFLVDNGDICERLDSLTSGEAGDAALSDCISKIACDCLGADWLNATRRGWNDHEELAPGERGVLSRALDRHERADYEGCVALLMNLIEGLPEKYGGKIGSLDDEHSEMFDIYAQKYGLNPSRDKTGKPRRLVASKNHVLLVLLFSDAAQYMLEYTTEYIVKVTLTNTMNEDLAAHNPLRNKICHGVQTEYGTLEHSLKAILVTDIIIRFGNAVREEPGDFSCDNNLQGKQGF